MRTKTCVLCHRDEPAEACQVFELSAREEASLLEHAGTLPEEFAYCRRCLGILADPKVGPRFMRDAAEREMLKLGVTPARAQQMADKYYTHLVESQRARHGKVH